MKGPMHGIRVVDLTIALSGPWASAILADQGADVVKVEPPGIGDIGRWVGVAIGGVSAMAQMVSRGKRSIAVDLKQPAGRDVVRRLVAGADPEDSWAEVAAGARGEGALVSGTAEAGRLLRPVRDAQ